MKNREVVEKICRTLCRWEKINPDEIVQFTPRWKEFEKAVIMHMRIDECLEELDHV